MSIPGGAPSLFLTAAAGAGAGFSIDRSLRFNSADSASLNFTPSSAGNRKTWTWSSWVKLNFEGYQNLFANLVNNNNGLYVYWNNGLLNISDYGTSYGASLYAERVFRDYSSWYHIVIAMDSTQGTASDRVKLYINGAQETLVGTQPSQNVDGYWNAAQAQWIGQQSNNVTDYNLDGYLAEVNFIDGSALDPTSFGELDDNNVWQPKDTSSLTFGTNGFRLKFDDNSSNAALGTDSSGNGNSWSVNNFSAVSAASAVTFSGHAWTQYKSTYNNNTTAKTKTGAKYRIELDDLFNGVVDGTSYSAATIFGINEFNSQGYIHDSLVSNDGTATTGFDNTAQTGTAWKGYFNYPSNSGKYASITVYDGSESDGTDFSINRPECDSLRDTPVNGNTANDTGAGGEITGNYATLNPLVRLGDPNATFSDGNLTASFTSANNYAVATIGITSGKYYYELTASTGVSSSDGATYIRAFTATGVSETFYHWRANGGTSGLTGSPTLSTYASGDVLGVGIDATNSTVRFYKNGTLQGSGDYTYTTFSGKALFIAAFANPGNRTCHWNFGQRPFAYTAPSGYKCLCTANLPDPTIADGSTAFDAKTFAANNGTQTISGFNFSPDLIWTKSRSNAYKHQIWDTVRGNDQTLNPNLADAEADRSGSLTFNSDGFTSNTLNNANYSSGNSIAWAWDAGSSTASNTDGSITSQVRANQTAGFSIVTWNFSGSLNKTIGHGLNAATELYFIKNRDASEDWYAYTTAIDGGLDYAHLNSSAAFSSSSRSLPTSSVFNYEGTTGDHVAYCFAPVAGFSAFGKYTGNGSSDGPFVYTGFRPALVIIKIYSGTSSNWVMLDSARDPDNVVRNNLYADTNDAENQFDWADFLSNGFKPRVTYSQVNGNNYGYVYMAWAENPFSSNGGLAR